MSGGASLRSGWPEEDKELGPLTDDILTKEMRIYQRKRGHRFSVDDVLTAREACDAAQKLAAEHELVEPQHLDLGCGIGSVLLMVHDRLRWPATGVEAQRVSFELAQRNVARNDEAGVLNLEFGDFRTVGMSQKFHLVTGTPPYFPPGTSIPSPNSQRAYARIEYRGGVEDYLEVASKFVRADGVIVICGDARHPERVTTTAAQLGLKIERQLNAFPRKGRSALFSVWTLRPGSNAGADTWEHADWTARDEDGARTEQAHVLRRYFGLEPNLSEHPSP